MTDTVFDITGKVTIVTGWYRHWRRHRQEFCARGARVMITSRTMDHLGHVAEGIRQAKGIETMVGDVRQPESTWRRWSTGRWSAGGALMC